MEKKAYCKACSNLAHGVKTPRAIQHTCGKEMRDSIRKEELRLKDIRQTIKIIESGYAGTMPNGNIVDRRVHPEAMPIPENPMFNTPKPKDV